MTSLTSPFNFRTAMQMPCQYSAMLSLDFLKTQALWASTSIRFKSQMPRIALSKPFSISPYSFPASTAAQSQSSQAQCQQTKCLLACSTWQSAICPPFQSISGTSLAPSLQILWSSTLMRCHSQGLTKLIKFLPTPTRSSTIYLYLHPALFLAKYAPIPTPHSAFSATQVQLLSNTTLMKTISYVLLHRPVPQILSQIQQPNPASYALFNVPHVFHQQTVLPVQQTTICWARVV